MGRWGTAMFQSDMELDVISDIGYEAGLEVVLEVIKANKSKYAIPGDDDFEYISMHHCKYPDMVRDYLDSGPLIDILIADRRNKTTSQPDGKVRWKQSEGYQLCMIAFCAMELGCELPDWFLKELKLNYKRVGLMEEATEQFAKALAEHRSGVPYDFYTKGLLDTANTGKSEHDDAEINWQDLEVVPKGEEITKENTKLVRMPFDFNNPADTCGNCGATRNYPRGGKLKRCAGCKKRLYCSKNCQKWHWSSHCRQCVDVKQVRGESSAEGESKRDTGTGGDIDRASGDDAMQGVEDN